jgi:hypothetical protein
MSRIEISRAPNRCIASVANPSLTPGASCRLCPRATVLTLCASALDCQDVAKMAPGQVNLAATAAALYVDDAISNACGMPGSSRRWRSSLVGGEPPVRSGSNRADAGQIRPSSISSGSPKHYSPVAPGTSATGDTWSIIKLGAAWIQTVVTSILLTRPTSSSA